MSEDKNIDPITKGKAASLHERHEEKVKKLNKNIAKKILCRLERELHRTLGVCSKTYRDKILSYKGFLSKEDSYIDYSEWHVASWSTALALATFLVHPVFLGLYVVITRRVLKDEYEEHSSLREIDGELPYWFGIFTVLAVYFQLFTSYGLEIADWVKALAGL